MKKQLNADAYILGLELTVKTLSNRIKELEETLNNERRSKRKKRGSHEKAHCRSGSGYKKRGNREKRG